MTSTEIAVRENSLGLAEKIEYATELAKADLLPRRYQNKPANILLIMEYGDYLGLPAVAAMNLINVIDNKPVASAELIAGRVRSAGHRMRVSYDAAKRVAACSIWRADDPGFEFRAEWSWDRAAAVRDKDGQPLTKKMNWLNYYPAMLKWRATTECARDACPEILLGVSHMPDEMGSQALEDDEADQVGAMTLHQRVEHEALRRAGEPPPGSVEKLTEADPDDPWAEPAQPKPPSPPSKAAAEKLQKLLRQIPLGEDHDVAVFIGWLTGEPAESDLTASSVRALTTFLEDALKAARGDTGEAASQIWRQYRLATGQEDRGDG